MPTDWNQHGRIAQERDLTRDHAQQSRDLQARLTEADRREIARFSDTTGLQPQPAPAAQVERVTALIHEATGDRSIQPSPFDELTVDSLDRATEMWEQKLGPERVAKVDASLASNTRIDWTDHDESGLTRLSSTDAPQPDYMDPASDQAWQAYEERQSYQAWQINEPVPIYVDNSGIPVPAERLTKELRGRGMSEADTGRHVAAQPGQASSVTVTPTAPTASVTPSSTPSHAATPPKPMRGIRR